MLLSRTELAVLCLFAIVLLGAQLAKEWPLLIDGVPTRDFAMLYVTAERASAQQPLYRQTGPASVGPLLNFNPPHLHVLLVPLTLVPLRTAYLVWNGISLLLLTAILHISVAETGRRLTRAEWYLLIACVLGSAGLAATLRLGQVSLWLALPLTLSWRAARKSRSLPTAIWFGIALSVKPFLLLGLPVLLLRGQVWVALLAGIVAVAALAAGGLWLGWSSLTDWLEVFRAPRGTAYTFNASLQGIGARADAPAIYGLLASAVVGLLTLWRVQRTDEDMAWALWLTAALLCSPLGWIYYLPMLTGPIVTLAVSRRLPYWTWYVLPAFIFPPIGRTVFQQNRLAAVTLGSVYGWGLLGLWLALFVRGRAHQAHSFRLFSVLKNSFEASVNRRDPTQEWQPSSSSE